MTFDEKLAQALQETFDERMKRRVNVTNKYRFSLAFRLWERKTLKSLRKNRYSKHWTLHMARRVVLTAAVAVPILFGVTACAATVMGRFYFDTKPDYSELIIENISTDKTAIEDRYGLPKEDGWEFVDYFFDNEWSVISYKRDDTEVDFDQRVIDGYIGNVNTENAVVEPMSVYEDNDGFFIAFNNGECGLYWIYDGYVFSISGNVDKEALIDLAYSAQIIDMPQFLLSIEEV